MPYFKNKNNDIFWIDENEINSNSLKDCLLITEEEAKTLIDLKQNKLNEIHEQGLTYVEKRQASYPSIGDQLDALYHAGVFPPEMAAQIAEIKIKYPKN
jgi:hypothetical protein